MRWGGTLVSFRALFTRPPDIQTPRNRDIFFLTNGGAWRAAFITGTVFASAAAALWLLIDPERPAEVD